MSTNYDLLLHQSAKQQRHPKNNHNKSKDEQSKSMLNGKQFQIEIFAHEPVAIEQSIEDKFFFTWKFHQWHS